MIELSAPADPIERPVLPAIFERLLAETTELYRDCILGRRNTWEGMLATNLKIFSHRAASNFYDLQRLAVPLPEGMLSHYRTDPKLFDRVNTPPKYRIRPYNLSRDLLRYACLAPELLDVAAPQDILELSPGACAAQELLAPLGHRVHFAEYEVGPEAKFGPIHTELGVTPTAFDGRRRPFPLPDGMADTVLCFQAFDAYTRSVADYREIFAEMQRLARRKCVVILNSYRPRLDPPEKIEAVKAVFADIPGVEWSICPDTHLLAFVWQRSA